MRVLIVTPAPPGSQSGNRVTAERWAQRLVELGHEVAIDRDYRGQRCHLLVALHAARSAGAVARVHAEQPETAVVIALTGTDVYGGAATVETVRRSLALAWRVVVLQPLAGEALDPLLRPRARVILQSAVHEASHPATTEGPFDVCVLGHLRDIKDPFRAAAAARLLPAGSQIRVVHIGAAHDAGIAAQAREEQRQNPRYRWLGELPRGEALSWLAASRLLALTSRAEGGANVISEAIVHGVPIVSSAIPGSIGLLGPDYPGYFAAGDTAALAELLCRFERDPGLRELLRDRCRSLAWQFTPERERSAWRALLAELPATGL